MKDIIETNRREAVREAELRGHAGSNNRGRHPPPAFPVGMDDNNNPNKSASDRAVTPKPTDRRRRGRSSGRSASPGVRTASSEGRKLGLLSLTELKALAAWAISALSRTTLSSRQLICLRAKVAAKESLVRERAVREGEVLFRDPLLP